MVATRGHILSWCMRHDEMPGPFPRIPLAGFVLMPPQIFRSGMEKQSLETRRDELSPFLKCLALGYVYWQTRTLSLCQPPS